MQFCYKCAFYRTFSHIPSSAVKISIGTKKGMHRAFPMKGFIIHSRLVTATFSKKGIVLLRHHAVSSRESAPHTKQKDIISRLLVVGEINACNAQVHLLESLSDILDFLKVSDNESEIHIRSLDVPYLIYEIFNVATCFRCPLQ